MSGCHGMSDIEDRLNILPVFNHTKLLYQHLHLTESLVEGLSPIAPSNNRNVTGTSLIGCCTLLLL
jgi:hypothetical protein